LCQPQRAGVAKLVYAPDSKSGERQAHVGSSPTSGTNALQAQLFHHETENLKPPLKWAGGKRWLLPHIEPLWQKHRYRRYVEPFCGGLAICLGLRPKYALLNDINTHLVNFYRQLQRGLGIAIKVENDEDLFYEYRAQFNSLI